MMLFDQADLIPDSNNLHDPNDWYVVIGPDEDGRYWVRNLTKKQTFLEYYTTPEAAKKVRDSLSKKRRRERKHDNANTVDGRKLEPDRGLFDSL